MSWVKEKIVEYLSPIVWWFTALFAFLPPKEEYSEESMVNIKYMELNGRKVAIHVVSPGYDSEKCILWFHGNANDVVRLRTASNAMADFSGFEIWSVEYSGYGVAKKLRPSVSFHEIYRDAEDAFELAAQKFGASNMIICGHSIGSGVACELALRLEKKGVRANSLVLFSPFYSLFAVAQGLLFETLEKSIGVVINPRFHDNFLLRFARQFDPMNNEEKIKQINIPQCYFHGNDDTLIPALHTIRLAGVCIHVIGPSITIYDECGHNDVITMRNMPSIIDAIKMKSS